MEITLEYLIERNACLDEQKIFVELFGTECELNEENLERYVKKNRYAFMGMRWIGINMLKGGKLGDFCDFYVKFPHTDPDIFAMALGRKLIKLLVEENHEKN